MTKSDPGEWEFLCPITATHVGPDGPAAVLINVGALRSPNWVGPRIALQSGDQTVILPPASAARLMGALRRGLSEVAGLDAARG